jgi:hypothetical protein
MQPISAPRLIYPDLSKFVPNAYEIEEWQIRKLEKVRALQNEQINSIHQERLNEFYSSATVPDPIAFDQSISPSELWSGPIPPELLERVLSAAETTESTERVPVEPPTKKPEHCE